MYLFTWKSHSLLQQEQRVVCILSVPPSGFLRAEPGFQALPEPLERPLVLGMFLPDLADDGINGAEPVLQLLLLGPPGLFSAAQGSVLPFLQCLQMLLARLVGHDLQKVLRKTTTAIASRRKELRKLQDLWHRGTVNVIFWNWRAS